MTLWYYVENEDRVGPVSEDDLNRLAESGRIRDDTLVWRDGLADWIAYSATRPPLTTATAAAPEPAATPAPFATVEEQALEHSEFGGFWIRFAAKFLDWIILAAINGTAISFMGLMLRVVAEAAGRNERFQLVLLLQLFNFVVPFAINTVYATFFLGRFAATPGKMVCGLRVLVADGSPISYQRALARHFAEMLSALPLMLGYVIAAFDPEKRALHDHICDTRVIWK